MRDARDLIDAVALADRPLPVALVLEGRPTVHHVDELERAVVHVPLLHLVLHLLAVVADQMGDEIAVRAILDAEVAVLEDFSQARRPRGILGEVVHEAPGPVFFGALCHADFLSICCRTRVLERMNHAPCGQCNTAGSHCETTLSASRARPAGSDFVANKPYAQSSVARRRTTCARSPGPFEVYPVGRPRPRASSNDRIAGGGGRADSNQSCIGRHSGAGDGARRRLAVAVPGRGPGTARFLALAGGVHPASPRRNTTKDHGGAQ